MIERGGVAVPSFALAAEKGRVRVARYLLERGASLTDVNSRGQCFLEYADKLLADLMLAAVTADPSALDRVANVSGFARRLLDSRQAEAADRLCC